MSILATAAILGSLVASVSAHGHVSGVVSNGQWYAGTTPEWTYHAEKPNTAGWYANNQDNGFVEPSAFADPDIVCHKGATPGTASIPATAGESITIQWNTWPESHHGPVLDYLAPVEGEFADVDKTALQFFKIAEGGVIDGSTAPGKWADDELIANNNSWAVTIPSSIAPGKYVLRHEMIALHSAGDVNGAQSYPQCINLEITSDGTETPAGVPATTFYKADDAGIKFNIYSAPIEYTIPGPALYNGAASPPSQTGSTPSAPASTTYAASSSQASSAAASSTQAPYSNSTASATVISSSSSAATTTATTEEGYATATSTGTATASSTAGKPTGGNYSGAPTTTATASSTAPVYASATSNAPPAATSTDAAPGGYDGAKPEKALPEDFTLADMQQWVAYLLNQGWSQSRNHARDFRL